MKIDSNSPVNNSSKAKKKKGVSSSGFSSLLGSFGETDEPSSTAATSLASPVSALDGLLAMQEVSDEEIAKKKALKQGNLTLDSLEDLRRAMIFGEVTPAKLQRVYNQIQQQKFTITNPELKAVMHEIEIRAAVELAKFGK